MMVCQQCLKRQASVHVTQILNNEKKEIHLCEQCASENEKKAMEKSLYLATPFSINDLLIGLLGKEQGYSVQQTERTTRPVCKNCNMTYEQFIRSGKFGCANCYNTFMGVLPSVFKKIHGNVRHHGKLPYRSGEKIKTKREIIELKTQLNRAVQSEEYEKAAVLRDRMRALEGQLKEEI